MTDEKYAQMCSDADARIADRKANGAGALVALILKVRSERGLKEPS